MKRQKAKATKISALTEEQLTELQKDPKNVVYKFEDDDSNKRSSSFEQDEVLKRFVGLRNDFELYMKKRPDWTDDQCRMAALRDKTHWIMFLDSYPKITEFIFSRKNSSEQVNNLLSAMKNSVHQDKTVKGFKVQKDHPNYKEISDPRNQKFVSELHKKGLLLKKK